MRIKNDYTIFPRKMPSGKVVYYYQTYDEKGRRTVPHSTGKSLRTEAWKECNRLLKLGYLVPSKRIPIFRQYAEGWFNRETCAYTKWRELHDPLTDGTIDTSAGHLRGHILSYFGDMRLDTITEIDIENWMLELADKEYKHTYINNHYYTLRVMLSEAVRRKILHENVAMKVEQLKENCRSIEILTIPEVRKLFPARWNLIWDSYYLYLLNKVAAFTGMRAGELLGLRGDCVFPEYIRVEWQYTAKKKLTGTKTKKSRNVPITGLIYEDLYDLIKKNGTAFLFSEDGGETPLSRSTLRSGYINALKKIGIDDTERQRRGLSPHSWRHFLNTKLVMENISDRKVLEVTGQVSIDVNKRYTHLKSEEFKDVVAAQQSILITRKKRETKKAVKKTGKPKAAPTAKPSRKAAARKQA
ncbi:site-specific recombinase, phage integrase family [Treponema primitia ZAS-2]|uniref:Site-specific recombinase, phage integrase family n=1 Tax=Treponema primitia (strain ATCC BAA-887 / DSM 12427 / ZAS-2) TaxID=545694 RepID=F5YJQ9_TREPZ|nr:site-specific integrase [Treponema primitia]AEF85874.1 site-specific recombinase, phage integrase family [Treponema primitia ZAS-2]